MRRGWSLVCVVVGRSDQVAKGTETELGKVLLDNQYRIFGARDPGFFETILESAPRRQLKRNTLGGFRPKVAPQ
jgi:hypothetical protein